MPPPVSSFPASALPYHVQSTPKGTRRKGFDGDLKKCELSSMLQYRCHVDNPGEYGSRVRCWPVERLFRRYVSSERGSFRVI
ncbi:hypothetical protein B0O99DRAFT_613679 [Bisporella sp. PMI_857]|nr:hypothetical protein B0O99DRAFT_613679 [Bisporella sp. PMI_857]